MLCPLALCLSSAAFAQSTVDLSRLDAHDAAPRTQVFVLGTVHLADAPKTFKPASLGPVLDRLASFKPQIITVEQISGESCDAMARHPAIYAPEDVRPYCRDTSAARSATGLDVPAAIAEVVRTLKHWPDQPAFAQRRHLAALFLAAGDAASAMVQWLYLPDDQRRAGDGLSDTLATQLRQQAASNDESFQIAAPLAVRLGLQRVFGVDDHTGDNVNVADAAAFGSAIQHAWDSAAEIAKPLHASEAAFWQRGDMLALYRFINQPSELDARIRSDFGAALGDASPQHYGQIYVAGWETRNLRMVANVHAAFRESPGVRVLSLVGVSHKPWFDNLLGQMQGVDIVDAEKVLE
ncbi:DUF5694 domain-containing protein [Dyella jiangningensis]|uniref:TraB/GumN family protein n=1 Tax=Dyella jiangningensis TaxID=1379159 RepID=A0A328NXG6_9GAMM|nr:hypothetical protein CA260_18355 [Dyella jiangningensis]